MNLIVPNYLIQSALEDLVSQIAIADNFQITHPRYEPTETPEDVVAKLRHMPTEVQRKYLTLQLKNFLQGIYYQGNWAKIDTFVDEKLENPGNLESGLFKKFDKNNHGTGYLDDDWLVTGKEEGLIVLYKDELTLHVEPDRYLPSEYQNPSQGELIPVKFPNSLVEYSYYVAVGNAGTAYTQTGDRTINIYFNFDVETALAFTSLLTQQLNAIEVPFTFKCLYDSAQYERYDSGLLNIEFDRYPQVKTILETIYQEYQTHFTPEIPLFTKFLAPGVSLAEELAAKDSPEDSFGKHRCQILAQALIQAWQNGRESPEERMRAIEQHFSQAAIDLKHPYLTFNSQNIYTPLH
jgi:hypothetical protein